MTDILRISRRAAMLGGLALPWLTRSAVASAPMGDAELQELLWIFERTRKMTAIQTDTMTTAKMLAARDEVAGRIMAASGGHFANWRATAKEAKWHETGRWLGYRVALDRDTSLQTYIGNDDDKTATMIPMNDPLADVAKASTHRTVLVSGVIQLKDGAPIDLLAQTPKAGEESSLLVKFTRIV